MFSVGFLFNFFIFAVEHGKVPICEGWMPQPMWQRGRKGKRHLLQETQERCHQDEE